MYVHSQLQLAHSLTRSAIAYSSVTFPPLSFHSFHTIPRKARSALAAISRANAPPLKLPPTQLPPL